MSEAPGDWLTRKDASAYLGKIGLPMAPHTLANRAANNNRGKGPPFHRLRGGWNCVWYKRSDLDAWAKRELVRVE